MMLYLSGLLTVAEVQISEQEQQQLAEVRRQRARGLATVVGEDILTPAAGEDAVTIEIALMPEPVRIAFLEGRITLIERGTPCVVGSREKPLISSAASGEPHAHPSPSVRVFATPTPRSRPSSSRRKLAVWTLVTPLSFVPFLWVLPTSWKATSAVFSLPESVRLSLMTAIPSSPVSLVEQVFSTLIFLHCS
jgi:hypothetical protein